MRCKPKRPGPSVRAYTNPGMDRDRQGGAGWWAGSARPVDRVVCQETICFPYLDASSLGGPVVLCLRRQGRDSSGFPPPFLGNPTGKCPVSQPTSADRRPSLTATQAKGKKDLLDQIGGGAKCSGLKPRSQGLPRVWGRRIPIVREHWAAWGSEAFQVERGCEARGASGPRGTALRAAVHSQRPGWCTERNRKRRHRHRRRRPGHSHWPGHSMDLNHRMAQAQIKSGPPVRGPARPTIAWAAWPVEPPPQVYTVYSYVVVSGIPYPS